MRPVPLPSRSENNTKLYDWFQKGNCNVLWVYVLGGGEVETDIRNKY